MNLEVIEEYYDAAPRPLAAVEEIGPFTLFVRNDPTGWPYYARPRLGVVGRFTVDDISAVLARQATLGEPAALEWVHEVTPTLRDAAQAAGLVVESCPLLALPRGSELPTPNPPARHHVERLTADSPRLADVLGAIGAAFSEVDTWSDSGTGPWPGLLSAGLTRLVGAFESGGAVGGGSHSPRGTTTDLTGIGVLPKARGQSIGRVITALLAEDARALGVETIFLSAQDDAVARVYARVGFESVATACIASRP